jgi:hypothetical protein
MTKETQNPNDKYQPQGRCIRISSFVILSDFGFGHSDFCYTPGPAHNAVTPKPLQDFPRFGN